MLEEENEEDDTRGERTLTSVKKYSIKSAIFNLAASWKDVKLTTLSNSWNKLLHNTDPELDFEGFQASDFRRTLQLTGETLRTEDVEQWLEETDNDPGYQIQSVEEIAQEALTGETEQEVESEDDADTPVLPKPSLVRSYLDTIITYVDLSENSEIQNYYQHLRRLSLRVENS